MHRLAWIALIGGCVVDAPPPTRVVAVRPTATILVQTASYGANCGVPTNNVTERVAAECNGKSQCFFKANNAMFGDPAVHCPKDFAAEWTCNGRSYRTAPIHARVNENNQISLTCPN